LSLFRLFLQKASTRRTEEGIIGCYSKLAIMSSGKRVVTPAVTPGVSADADVTSKRARKETSLQKEFSDDEGKGHFTVLSGGRGDNMIIVCKACEKVKSKTAKLTGVASRLPCRWKEHKSTTAHENASAPSSQMSTILSFPGFTVTTKRKQTNATTPLPTTTPLTSTPSPPQPVTTTPPPTRACKGAFAKPTNIVLTGMKYYYTYYVGADESTWLVAFMPDSSPHSQHYALKSIVCTGTGLSRKLHKSQTNCCSHCYTIGQNQHKALTSLFTKKARLIEGVLSHLKKSKLTCADIKDLADFCKTSAKHFSAEGRVLKERVTHAADFGRAQEKMQNAISTTASTEVSGFLPFLHQFAETYKTNKAFRGSLMVQLVQGYLSRVDNPTSPLPLMVMNFYMSMTIQNTQAARFAAANLKGPVIRSIQRRKAKNRTTPIVLHEKEHILERLKCIVEDYDCAKEGSLPLVISIALDATKVPMIIQLSQSYQIFVGTAWPDHIHQKPETAEDLERFMFLKDTDPKFKKAGEIKVALVAIQNPKEGLTISYPIAARPQLTNQVNDFNEVIVETTREFCNDRTNNCRFLNSCVDGVSSDTEFVDSNIDRFFIGEYKLLSTFFAMTILTHCSNASRGAA
jgi:hypothetical protein